MQVEGGVSLDFNLGIENEELMGDSDDVFFFNVQQFKRFISELFFEFFGVLQKRGRVGKYLNSLFVEEFRVFFFNFLNEVLFLIIVL